MKFKVALGFVVAAVLALTSLSVVAGQGQGAGAGAGDRDQQMDRDRDFDRDRDMDRDMDHDFDRDRDMDRDRTHDQLHEGGDQDQTRDQDRDRIHQDDSSALSSAEIYGSELMTEEEMNQYRKKYQSMSAAEERKQFQAQHEEQMRVRALQQGKDLVPPGQGPVYGGDLMTVQERNQYREQLRNLQSEEEKTQFMAQHREQMNERAQALELEVEEAE